MKKPSKSICIIHPNKSSYSESFIDNHIRHLPGKKHIIYGTDRLHLQHHTADRALVPLPVRILMRHYSAFSYTLSDRTGSASAPVSLDPASKYLLSRFLQKARVDAVLAEYGTSGVLVMDSCRQAGVPLIVHFHGADAHSRHILNSYRVHYQKLFRQAAAVVAVSHTMEKQLSALGAPEELVSYNPYGVDLQRFTATRPDRNPPVFIAVGRFVDKKAPHLVLLAFRHALERCPGIRLVMVGDGRLQEACRQTACALGIQESVEMPGWKNNSEIPFFFNHARAFVQHSITTAWGDSEGTPVALLEAGAAGLPVISTRHAGIADVVIHNKTGYLVEEYDIAAMAEYMVLMAQDGDLAAAVGRHARLHIEKHFSLQQSIQNLFDIISRVS